MTKDQEEFKKNADFCMEFPDIEEELSALLSVIPTQILAYKSQVLELVILTTKNLAKSVTVEFDSEFKKIL